MLIFLSISIHISLSLSLSLIFIIIIVIITNNNIFLCELLQLLLLFLFYIFLFLLTYIYIFRELIIRCIFALYSLKITSCYIKKKFLFFFLNKYNLFNFGEIDAKLREQITSYDINSRES